MWNVCWNLLFFPNIYIMYHFPWYLELKNFWRFQPYIFWCILCFNKKNEKKKLADSSGKVQWCDVASNKIDMSDVFHFVLYQFIKIKRGNEQGWEWKIESLYYLTEETRGSFFPFDTFEHTYKINWKNISFPLYVITLLFIQILYTILSFFFFF